MKRLWAFISDLGAQESDNGDFLRKIHLVNQLSFLSTLTTFVFVVHIYLIGNYYYLPFQFGTGLLCCLYYFLSVKRHFHAALYWIFFLIFFNIEYCSIEIPNSGVEYFLIPLGLIPFTILDNKRACIALTAFTALGFFTSYFLKLSYKPHQPIPALYTEITFIVILITVFLLSAIIIFQFKTVNVKYEAIIHEQKQLVEEKNKDMMDSINYAKRIQQSKLPHMAEVFAALPQCFILFKPKDIVSGDFYFFQYKNNRAFIAAADCTGHGVPGSLMSMICSEKLNDALAQSNNVSDILSLTNKGIKTSLRQTGSDESTRDGMDIAFCALNLYGKTVEYAGANRPLWIIKKDRNDVEELKATKKAIGGLTEEDQHFEAHKLNLQEGDTVYLFSDGYADTFSGRNNKKLTTKKFKEILCSIQGLTMPEQQKYLDNFIEDWKSGTEQVDDILVIGIRL